MNKILSFVCTILSDFPFSILRWFVTFIAHVLYSFILLKQHMKLLRIEYINNYISTLITTSFFSPQNKQVMSLDIGLLMSGAKERGELEARVTALINEITESG